jgi:hypothetical protein
MRISPIHAAVAGAVLSACGGRAGLGDDDLAGASSSGGLDGGRLADAAEADVAADAGFEPTRDGGEASAVLFDAPADEGVPDRTPPLPPPEIMCDGSSLAGNVGDAARLALAVDSTNLLHGYFSANAAVYGCPLPQVAPSPPPAPAVVLPAGGAGGCLGASYQYSEVVSDPSQAYVLAQPGLVVNPCYGWIVPLSGGAPYPIPSLTTSLVSDRASPLTLFSLSPTAMYLLALHRQGMGASSEDIFCITPPASGTLSAGAAFGGNAVAVDASSGVILGATVTAGACTTPAVLATNVTAVVAVAVGYSRIESAGLFAFNSGQNLYVCKTTGCAASYASAPLVVGQAPTPPTPPTPPTASDGLVFDTSPAPNLYWVAPQGLSRCSAVTSGSTCTPQLLVPGVRPTTGLAVDGTYVYYLQGMQLYRVPK